MLSVLISVRFFPYILSVDQLGSVWSLLLIKANLHLVGERLSFLQLNQFPSSLSVVVFFVMRLSLLLALIMAVVSSV